MEGRRSCSAQTKPLYKDAVQAGSCINYEQQYEEQRSMLIPCLLLCQDLINIFFLRFHFSHLLIELVNFFHAQCLPEKSQQI